MNKPLTLKNCPICKSAPADFSTKTIVMLAKRYPKVCRRCAGNAV